MFQRVGGKRIYVKSEERKRVKYFPRPVLFDNFFGVIFCPNFKTIHRHCSENKVLKKIYVKEKEKEKERGKCLRENPVLFNIF